MLSGPCSFCLCRPCMSSMETTATFSTENSMTREYSMTRNHILSMSDQTGVSFCRQTGRSFLPCRTLNFRNSSKWGQTIQTRLTLEEIVPDSWRKRNVLAPDWSCRLYTSGRIRIKNYPVWSCLRRFWIRNLKWELWIRKLLNPESFVV